MLRDNKMRTPRPASHPRTSFTDEESVSLIKNILASHRRVMPKIDSISAWPNIDGYIEIQNKQNAFVGRLPVQVKTLPNNHKLKFRCPVSFFSSCELDPCLLFGVDNQAEKVYWLYFDSVITKGIDFKKNKYTKTISFEPNQYFKKGKQNQSYVQNWEKIVKGNQSKLRSFDELKKAHEIILKESNKAVGRTESEFVKLHTFVDRLNELLENEFLIIKKHFYQRIWKIGIAVYEYKPEKISYALYPIPLDKNDVQIKEVDKNLHDRIQKEGLGFTGHFVENPIKVRPREYAEEVMASKTFKIVENKLLNHSGNKLLAQETIFNFVSHFYNQMGLPKKDEYKVEEVKKSSWIRQMSNTQILHINGKQINLRLFFEFLDFLEKSQTSIAGVYREKDFSRIPNGGWIWNVFSKKDAEYNLNIIFNNLVVAYKTIIKNNFPLLENELSLFGDVNIVAVSWNVKDEYQGFGSGPTYKMYYLRSKSAGAQHTIEVLDDVEAKEFMALDFSKQEINFRGERYEILSIRSNVLDFLYEDTPMLNLVYQILRERLKEYFNDVIRR